MIKGGKGGANTQTVLAFEGKTDLAYYKVIVIQRFVRTCET